MDIDVSLVEDLQELSLEKNIQTFKSDEELRRHTVDEHLSPIERSVYLLSIRTCTESALSGQEVQRFSVINNLPEILEEHNAECMRRVVPKVREVLHVAQAEMQLAACSAFLQILQKDLVPIQNYTQTFLQTILMSLDCRDPDIANAWLETLLDVIDLLPREVIKRDIMSIAVAKGQLSQSVQSRLACCRILGKIATKFEPFVIKKDILPVVQSLCQDVDYEVRGCMCRQLDPVARGLGLEQTKSAILPELLELTNDEESYVRLAGLETVVNVLSLLDDETCINTIIPLVCKFCQQALSSEDNTLPVVAKQLGRLTHGLSVNLAEDQKKWFLDYYKKLCKLGLSDSSKHKDPDPPPQPKPPIPNLFLSLGSMDMIEEEDPLIDCRRNAGYNFPAMVMFSGCRYFKSELLSTFCNLCDDPNYLVRKTMAAGFHEVAKLLGNHAHIIQPELLKLLNDDSTEVLGCIVSHLPETIELLAKAGNSSNNDSKQTHSLVDLLPGFVNCEGVLSLSNNWRLQAEFMDKLSCLPRSFKSEDIYQNIIPLMFRKLHSARAIPVRLAAVQTLLILLRHNHRLEQREDMCFRLREEFCRGHSCYQRNLFIEICKKVLDLFSRAFFKEHFFECLLGLCVDPIPNVRLRLCPLLPRLKRLIKLPADRNLLQLLETYVRKLLVGEKDMDVQAAIDVAVQDLDRIQIHMETQLNKKSYIEEDLVDQRKEEAEKRLLDIEEQEKREEIEAARSAKGERRRQEGAAKKDSGSRIPGPRKGSKIPAATHITRDKPGSSTTTRTERSSSFGGMVSNLPPKDVKRSPSLNSKASGKVKASPSRGSTNSITGSPRPTHRKISPTSANSTGSRKTSASSVSSSSSSSSSGYAASRKASGVATGEASTRRSSLPGIQKPRRISTGSMGNGASGIALRKK